LRDETEWVELITSGWNRLCPPLSADCIAEAIRQSTFSVGADVSPYGNGWAAATISSILASA
jgi:UDP-GlcNAc3NAcA epimerase